MRLDSIILQSVQQLKCGVLYNDVQERRKPGVEQLDEGTTSTVIYPGSCRRAAEEPAVLKKELTAQIAAAAPLTAASPSVMCWCFTFFWNQMHRKNWINLGVAVIMVTIFLCVLCCGLSLHGHGRTEHRAGWTINECSLTKATALNMFNAGFYLSYLRGGYFRVFWGVFCGQHFSRVNKYSITAGEQYLFLQSCLCAAKIETEERNGFCLSPKCSIITNSNAFKATRILIHL